MFFFDIITLAVIGWMIFRGKRDGFVSQLLSLVGVIFGVVLAISYGDIMGKMLNIDPKYAEISGFVIIFIATVIVAFILAGLLSKIISVVKLSWLNNLLGILFSVLKGLIVLGLIYAAIFAVNARAELVEPKEFDKSISFNVVSSVANPLIEYWEQSKP